LPTQKNYLQPRACLLLFPKHDAFVVVVAVLWLGMKPTINSPATTAAAAAAARAYGIMKSIKRKLIEAAATAKYKFI